MTDWKTVHGSQSEQPQEFDTTTSAFVVYQRRNIRKEKVRDANGVESDIWQYEERELTREEYTMARVEAQQGQIDQNRADIDFISAMAEIDL